MREKDLQKLEYDKVKDKLSEFTHSEATKERIALLKPITDKEKLKREIELTKAFFKVAERISLYEFSDVREYIKKAKLQGAVLGVEDILKVLNVIELSKELRKTLSTYAPEEEPLRKLLKKLHLFSPLENLINSSIDRRGFVKDEASDELLRVRKTIRTVEQEIKKRLESLINRPDSGKFLADRIITIRNGRYVVPVKTAHVKKIFGIVHGTSSSGYTTYVEPQFVIHLNNKLTELKTLEEDEIRKVLQRISEYIGDYAKELSESFEAIVDIDLLKAKYELSKLFGGIFPEFGSGVELYDVKHPILVDIKEEVIPIDIIMNEKKGIILTGPNTGGKTVALKTLGLSVLLFQSAIPIPAREGSKLPIFKRVFVDIGDEQSIEQNLSTFSGHMQNIAEFIRLADKDTLVLVDELGAGTDPIEGSALGIGILEYLKKKEAWVFVTTHHTPIKLYATTSDYYVPASVLFDRETLKPLYKIAYNVVGESMAFYIAERYGIPKEVIEEAKKRIGDMGEKYVEAMEKLSEYMHEYQRKQNEVERLKRELEEEKRKLEELRREYEEAKRKGWKEAYREAKEFLRKLSYEAEELKQKKKEEIKEFIKKKREEMERLIPKEKVEVNVGDLVEFMGKRGKVIEKKNGKVRVLLDNLKIWVDEKELRKCGETKTSRIPFKSSDSREVPKVKDSVNLIGKDTDSAILELEKFLEEAYSLGLKAVKVIHGIGSGKLKSAVREYLSKSDRVRFFRDAYPREGGSGVTIVYLNYGEEEA